MPPKSKPKARAFNSGSSSKPVSKDPKNPPSPFKKASENLEPFLSELSPNHVYITHIDTKPRDFKLKIFAMPVLMNVAIVALIVWRISIIGPYYMKVLFSSAGQSNETTMDKSRTTKEFIEEVLRRTLKFVTDLAIYTLVWPWPKDFFLGQEHGNPVAWRIGVGFSDKEIIVRRSKRWDQEVEDILLESGPGQQLLFPKVWRAVDPGYMSEKTGYLMLNKDWDLDWNNILMATHLVDKKTLSLEDFRTTIYVHTEQFGWLTLQTTSAGGSAKEEEGRRKIVAFKDELTAMGKENLFFKWIELVQFESAKPDGFGPQQQAKTMAKAKAMFESQGVDFDKFWKKIGGMEGMPGMDQQ